MFSLNSSPRLVWGWAWEGYLNYPHDPHDPQPKPHNPHNFVAISWELSACHRPPPWRSVCGSIWDALARVAECRMFSNWMVIYGDVHVMWRILSCLICLVARCPHRETIISLHHWHWHHRRLHQRRQQNIPLTQPACVRKLPERLSFSSVLFQGNGL